MSINDIDIIGGQLVWVNNGNGERELEIWYGGRKVCSVSDVCDQWVLEQFVTGNRDDFKELKDSYEEEDRENESKYGDLKDNVEEAIDRLNDIISELEGSI